VSHFKEYRYSIKRVPTVSSSTVCFLREQLQVFPPPKASQAFWLPFKTSLADLSDNIFVSSVENYRCAPILQFIRQPDAILF
jgi:hypothetical protein